MLKALEQDGSLQVRLNYPCNSLLLAKDTSDYFGAWCFSVTQHCFNNFSQHC